MNMIMLNDDTEETSNLRSYHVQDPAQTNTKDLNKNTTKSEVMNCHGNIDQIHQKFQRLIHKKSIISIP